MKGPAALQRPLVSLPITARPVTEAETARLDALRFWAAIERAERARKAALLETARDAVRELREGEVR